MEEYAKMLGKDEEKKANKRSKLALANQDNDSDDDEDEGDDADLWSSIMGAKS